jgi:anti-sigma regulatory factor (Ser/Thr protein kinase)
MSYYRLSLFSKLEEIPRLRHCLGAVARIEGYSKAFIEKVELSVHEVFVNAVRHGNRDDAALPVTMTLDTGEVLEKPFLEVRIKDCGEGFEPERTIAAICSARAGIAPGGRGLFLVNQFADSFRIKRVDGGCVVVLRYIPY